VVLTPISPVIVYENGKSGFLGEHSCMDGTPTLRMHDFMLGSLAAGKIDLSPARTARTASNLPAPIELGFTLDSKTETNIREAEKRFDALVAEHDMHVLHYEGYGKELIKKFKASPDAWAQLVKQLAFHRMFGRPGVCYESAQTRKYRLGRTEVIRSASNESKAWAEAMDDASKTDEQRAELFRKAVSRHLTYAGWAADGQGVDRHLFGLKRMLKEGEKLPEIYEDAAFGRTNHWELSTSQLSSPFVDGWGYGEGELSLVDSVVILANATLFQSCPMATACRTLSVTNLSAGRSPAVVARRLSSGITLRTQRRTYAR
jgi:carnitine O-acetyltransferase